MNSFMKLGPLAVTMVLCGIAGSVAQEALPSVVRSNATVQAIASRGLECDLLKPWQAVALESMVVEDMSRRPPEMMVQLRTEADRQAAEMTCESELLNVWIEGAARGFDNEMLPPYLVAYKVLAGMDTPPEIFIAETSPEHYGSAIGMIEAKLAALEADGVVPEGGRPWPEYIERTSGFVEQFAELVADEGASGPEVEQAERWLALTGRIIELWLMEP